MSKANLYPPRIDSTYQDVFLNTESCRVYFALSGFNDLEDIDRDLVQISIVSHNTNQDVTSKNGSQGTGVLFKTLQEDTTKQTDDRYYITIYSSDIDESYLQNNNFSTEFFYQVQIRFTSSEVSLSNKYYLSYWLDRNKNEFSEWSAITLVKAIEKPTLQITGAKDGVIEIAKNLLTVAGSVTLAETAAQVLDYVSYFRLTLVGALTQQVSDKIYPSDFAKNTFTYTFPKILNEEQYGLSVEYELSNGYYASEFFEINVNTNYSDIFNVEIKCDANVTDGQMKITINNLSKEEDFDGILYIKRTSQFSNFEDWEDVAIIEMNGGDSIYWIDGTAESGIWYKYGTQIARYKEIETDVVDYMKYGEIKDIEKTEGYDKKNNPYWVDNKNQAIKPVWDEEGELQPMNEPETHKVSTYYKGYYEDPSPLVIAEEPVMLYLDDAFLINNYTQLKIKYNPQISSFRYVVKDTIQETLGSKQPYVSRNGRVYYRTFPISGLIARSMDDNFVFTTYEELFPNADVRQMNMDFNWRTGVHHEYDFTKERLFREKVMDFLYSSDAFLFKSPTEGNIIIRLTDVNLSPIQSLGRRLYTFSATATEIDDLSIYNCDKYKIQKCNLSILHDWVIICDKDGYNRLENRIDITHTIGGFVHQEGMPDNDKNVVTGVVVNTPENVEDRYTEINKDLRAVLTKEYHISGNTKNYGLNTDYVIPFTPAVFRDFGDDAKTHFELKYIGINNIQGG